MNAILEQINSAGYAFVEFALPMLVQSSVLIVILLSLDFVLKKKVRAVFRYCIWMLVLVKLVLPSSLSSPVSFGYWLGVGLPSIEVTDKSAAVSEVNMSRMAEPASIEVSSGAPAPMMNVGPAVMEAGSQPVVTSAAPVVWQGVVFLVWLAVVVVMGLLLLQRAIFVSGLVAQAKEPSSLMDDALKYCCRCIGIRGKVGLKVSANATSPAVCGLFRPVILVPENLGPSLGAGGLRVVLLHELAHIKRGDLWVNLVQTALQIIYFYNPLLWLANAMIRRVREQAVDETVQVAMGEKAGQYPETLVNVAKLAFKRPALSLRLIGVVESKSALKGRVRHMLNRPIPRSAKLGLVGLLAVIIIGAVLLPMAKAVVGLPELVIKGTVTDAETGEPIAGAKVFDDGYGPEPDWTKIQRDKQSEWGAITNSAGKYSFLTWPEHHCIKVEAPAYKAKKENLYSGHFTLNKKDEEIFDFALEKGQSEEPVPSAIPAEFVGHWKGQGKIIVNWTKQRWLNADIAVKADGSAEGTIGDAKFVNGKLKYNRNWFLEKMNWNSKYIIKGDLQGDIIAAEQIRRESANILFEGVDDDGKIRGTIHSSGWHIGGKNTMVLTSGIELEKTSAEDVGSTDDYSSITVREGVGFDEIIFGCTGDFIKSRLGKPDKETKNEKDWWLNYSKTYGLGFWVNPQENYLIEIRLNKGFKGELTSGISMSSAKQDVFDEYGEPIRQEVAEDFDERFDNQLLLFRKAFWPRKPHIAKIYYDEHGLLFWFDGDTLNQIVVYRKTNKTDVEVESKEQSKTKGRVKSAKETKAPIEQNLTNEAVYRQLEEVVELSGLNPEMAFAEAIEEIRNSVDPPLRIVVMWRDLYDDADIDQTTPINMDAIPAVRLVKGLKLLLDSVSGGFAELGFVVEDGVITITTKESLPAGLETRVYDISKLVNTSDEANDLGLLIVHTVAPESWGRGGGRIIAHQGKKLVVSQTYEVHREIQKLLAGLRTSSAVQVEAEAASKVSGAGKMASEKQAVEAASAWLKLIDDGDYEESWEQAAGFFKKAVGKEQFRQSVEPVRKPLGKVTSRKVKSKTYTRQVPGAPDGEYVVIQFETAFENKKAAIETVTPMLDKDGKWRVSGYYVR